MFIDCSKLPNPADPQVDDVYTSPGSTHVLVVTSAPYRDEDTYYMRLVRDGTMLCIHAFDFPAILTSLALRPWGRLDRSNADGRPKITVDPQLVEQRLEGFGPHLRALREQYGLSMGDLSRALGCPPARLSMLELAQPDQVREGAGVREDEGRAALAELLAETAADAFVNITDADARDPGPRHRLIELADVGRAQRREAFKDYVWPTLAGMLATEPARAAMETIVRAIAAATAATGTGAWEQPDVAHLVDVLLEGMVTATTESDQAGPVDAEDVAGTRALLLHLLTSPRATAAMRRFLEDQTSGLFRIGDRIRHGKETGRIVGLDVDPELGRDGEVSIELDSGGHWMGALNQLELVNADVAIETARAGLSCCLAVALQKYMDKLSDNSAWSALRDESEAGELFNQVLATDEAQRLIRLHG